MNNDKTGFTFCRLKIPFIIVLTFWIIASTLWHSTGNVFYLFNFGYIGTAVGLGIGFYSYLPSRKKPTGRRMTQLLIGVYMLGFLGLFKHENMQLEGFFFYLLSGYFSGSVIHYSIAKIFGPVLFGRSFCGWACWTAMVLDLLPYKRNKAGRLSVKVERFRYFHFILSFLVVLVAWFIFHYRPEPSGDAALTWLIGGNALYFISAFILAFALRDNRAFCKYLCPITVILKATSRFSLLKIEGIQDSCTTCGACNASCPMDINIMNYVLNGERILSSECVFCLTCTSVCPETILTGSFKVDIGGKERIKRRKSTD